MSAEALVEIGELRTLFTGDISDLQTKAAQARQIAQQTAKAMSDALGQAGTGAMQSSIQAVQQSLSSLSASFSQIGIAMTAAMTAPIAAIGALGISFNAMKESATVAFTQLLGSGERAKSFLQELAAFAAATPFEFPDLVRAAQKFTAVGIEAKHVIPIMTALGDAVAAFGGSSDTISRVTEQIIQMVGKGKVAMEEMRIIGQSIPGSLQAMAKEMGITVDELFKRMEKGSITAAAGLEAMLVGLTKQFHGQMEKQSQTFQGLMSTLKDTVRFAAGDITEQLFGVLKGGLVALVEYLPKVVAAFGMLPDSIKAMTIAIAGVAAAVGPVLLILASLIALLGGPLTLTIAAVTITLAALTAAVALNFDRIGAIVGQGTGKIRINFVSMAGYAGGVVDAFQVFARSLIAAFDITVTGAILMVKGIRTAFAALDDVGAAIGKLVSGDLTGFASAVKNIGTNISENISGIGGTLKGLFGRLSADIANITSHANGEFAKSFAMAAARAGQTASTVARSMDETIASLREAFEKMKNVGKDGAGKAGKAAGTALLNEFKEGAAGLDQAIALLTAKQLQLPDLFDPISKKAKAGAQELKAALTVVAAAMNDFFKAAGVNASVTAEQLAKSFTKFIPTIEITDAFKHLKESIGSINTDRATAGLEAFDDSLKIAGDTVSLSSNLLDELRVRFPDIAHDAEAAGLRLHRVFPEITLDLQKFIATLGKEADDKIAVMLKDSADWFEQWSDSLKRSFQKASDAAPHWAGAIVDSANKIKKSLEESANLIRAKAELEIQDSLNSTIETFARLGEQAGLTGAALIDFVSQAMSKLTNGVGASSEGQKALADFAARVNQLPGALDKALDQMLKALDKWNAGSITKVKGTVSGILEIFDAIPGKLHNIAQSFIDWVNRIDSILKGLHKIFQSIPDGLGNLLSSIIKIAKGASSQFEDLFPGIGSLIIKNLTPAQKLVEKALDDLIGPVTQSAVKTGAAIGKGISDGIGSFLSSAGGILAAVIGAVTLSLNTFQSDSKYKRFLGSFVLGGPIGGLLALFFGGPSEEQKAQTAANIAKYKSDVVVYHQQALQAVEDTKQSMLETATKIRELLESITFYTAIPKDSFKAFFRDLDKVMRAFADRAKEWLGDSSAKIKVFGDDMKVVAESIAAVPTALIAISKYLGTPQSSIDRFFADLGKLLTAFGNLREDFTRKFLRHVRQFGEQIEPATKLLSDITGGIVGMVDLKPISTASFDVWENALREIIKRLGAIAEYFDKFVIKEIGFFAEKVAPGVALWKDSVEVIKSMVDIPVPTQSDFDNLFDSILKALQGMTDLAQQLDTEALLKAQSIAESSLSIFSAIKAAVEALGALREYKQVGSEAMAIILDDFERAIGLMTAMNTKSELFILIAKTFEENIKIGAEHLKNAVDIFLTAIKNLGYGLAQFGVQLVVPEQTSSLSLSPVGPSGAGLGGWGASNNTSTINVYIPSGAVKVINPSTQEGQNTLKALEELFGVGMGLDGILDTH